MLTPGLMLPAERIPVIIGVGEITERSNIPVDAISPVALMRMALLAADEDTQGSSLLKQLDSLDIVNSITCRYENLEDQLSIELGFKPHRVVHGPVGGESPLRYIHEAAARIILGESQVAAVCGAEAMYSQAAARRAGVELGWPEQDTSWKEMLELVCQPEAVRLGVAEPTSVYPFYENALQAANQQTTAESRADSANIWARYSAVASTNPHAWNQKAFDPEQIGTPSAENRVIAWPYTKRMVANPMVNQGCAILVTSLAKARAAGVAEEKIVHIWAGASALETRDYLKRESFHRSPAMEAVLNYCREVAGEDFAVVELYSCFPCVPKMAAKVLDLAPEIEPTVTGGLSFFGAPLNNYMSHATAAMVRQLRTKRGQVGLLYGQGEFVTKHHGLVLASKADDCCRLALEHSVQEVADTLRDSSPPFVERAQGVAVVETHTVLFSREGAPLHGVVILRTSRGLRTIAKVLASDVHTLNLLTHPQKSPVGLSGSLRVGDDGGQEWTAE